jgi:hypothetical protein
MRFAFYMFWTILAPFFAGGIVWAFAPAVLPNWAIAIGFLTHLVVWGTVQEWLNENNWDR